MILKSIEPRNFGPFAVPTRIDFEPDVTVLTGPNDTGKSFLLRLIRRICEKGREGAVQQDEVNFPYMHEAEPAWDHDAKIGCTANFSVTASTRQYIPQAQGWDEIVVDCALAPAVFRRSVVKFRKGDKWTQSKFPVDKMPNSLVLPLQHEIGSIINLSSPNPAESKLLHLAFGRAFSFAKIQALADAIFESERGRAEDRLNEQARRMLPGSIDLEFRLRPAQGGKDRLAVSLVDPHGGYTPFGSRGAGVQKILTVIATLMGMDLDSEHVYILFDEPENSLHADAQHGLRSLLEALAEKMTVQVIYATHSPSMINTMRPQSIRLFQRTQKDGKATSVVENRPIHENYLRVRSSLGVSPADSLLYAPITVIVEGVTEVVALPLILKKFKEAGVPGFEDVDKLLSQVHFLTGEGDSFEYMCRLAKSQGAKPIIFLDGDKTRRLKGVAEKHPEVPMITLREGKESEELIPEERYFEAIAASLEPPRQEVSREAFEKWQQGVHLPANLMFTKRVERWLQDEFDGASLDKPRVMKRAVELAEAKEIDSSKFLELMQGIRHLLSSSDRVRAT